MPQLQLPRPSALLALYSYLHSRKIKILEMFNKVDRGENPMVSREEFIVALKAVSAPTPCGLASVGRASVHPPPQVLDQLKSRHRELKLSASLLVKPDWKIWLYLWPHQTPKMTPARV